MSKHDLVAKASSKRRAKRPTWHIRESCARRWSGTNPCTQVEWHEPMHGYKAAQTPPSWMKRRKGSLRRQLLQPALWEIDTASAQCPFAQHGTRTCSCAGTCCSLGTEKCSMRGSVQAYIITHHSLYVVIYTYKLCSCAKQHDRYEQT